jgi:hypothetical protein
VKRRLLALARGAHIPPPVCAGPPRPEPRALHQEALAEPNQPTDNVEDIYPMPAPALQAEPTPRVVHRVRHWYDEAEQPRFSDMKF